MLIIVLLVDILSTLGILFTFELILIYFIRLGSSFISVLFLKKIDGNFVKCVFGISKYMSKLRQGVSIFFKKNRSITRLKSDVKV